MMHRQQEPWWPTEEIPQEWAEVPEANKFVGQIILNIMPPPPPIQKKKSEF
jgi:hypothetical protein